LLPETTARLTSTVAQLMMSATFHETSGDAVSYDTERTRTTREYMHTLGAISSSCGLICWKVTHRMPNMNMEITPTFWAVRSCNFLTWMIGNTNIARSSTKCAKTDAKKNSSHQCSTCSRGLTYPRMIVQDSNLSEPKLVN
jgi:hypothetical protein